MNKITANPVFRGREGGREKGGRRREGEKGGREKGGSTEGGRSHPLMKMTGSHSRGCILTLSPD